MIIWLASYPKSGNTWVRSFLTTLLYSNDGELNFKNMNKINQYPLISNFKNLINNFNDIEQIKKNWVVSQEILNMDKKIKLLKTHHVLCSIRGDSFTNTENTLGAIYIVRDPRNVITSLKHHFSLKNYFEATKFLTDENRVIGIPNDKVENLKDTQFITIISSWKNHYNSWKKMKSNFLLIKYEDLLHNPIEEFKKITNYLSNLLNINFEEKKIEKAVMSNSFDRLKELENKEGFDESIKDKVSGEKKNFFNLGPKNDWKKILDSKTINKIENSFNIEMKELGYL